MDMSLSELRELVMNRVVWRAATMGLQRVGLNWVAELTEQNAEVGEIDTFPSIWL